MTKHKDRTYNPYLTILRQTATKSPLASRETAIRRALMDDKIQRGIDQVDEDRRRDRKRRYLVEV